MNETGIPEKFGLREGAVYRESVPKDRAALIRAFRRLKPQFVAAGMASSVPVLDAHIRRLSSTPRPRSIRPRFPAQVPGRASDRVRAEQTAFATGPPPTAEAPPALTATLSPGKPGAIDLLLLEQTGVLEAWARIERRAHRLAGDS
jgi:hypothetical protein